MKILITEQQLRLIIEGRFNRKPSLEFDEKYGTHLSQEYEFPGGYSSDEINEMIHKWLDANEYYEELSDIIDKLDYGYFPYDGITSLSQKIKFDVLFGMASGFNVDDIVWFSVKKVMAYMNKDVDRELNKMKIKDVYWVMSPSTLEKLKKELKK